MTAKVTIGIPTYARPDLLERALRSVSIQDLAHVEVVVSDNASPGNSTEEVVGSFYSRIPSLRYVRQSTNVGVVQNLRFLLDEARTPYFMWLADDDELSQGFVKALVDLLDQDPTAACATAHWMLMSSSSVGHLMPTSHYPQASKFARLIRYVWNSDDAFFYGLHRTEVLRSASFPGYWWPNRDITQGWAYVLLFDVVAWGRVVVPDDRAIRFINHDYTTKEYVKSAGRLAILRDGAKRINIEYFYWIKAVRSLGTWALPIFVGVSIVGLVRRIARRIAIRMFRRADPFLE